MPAAIAIALRLDGNRGRVHKRPMKTAFATIGICIIG